LETRLRNLLASSREEGIRAEELGDALSLSSKALEDLVGSLAERGRLLEVRDGRVRLPPLDGPLSRGRLRPRQEGTLGAPTLFFDEIDSTSEEVWRLLGRGEARHGLTVVAESQTAGRGRGKNTWHSPKGTGLWFSVLLELDLPGDLIACLTQVVGVQLSLALESALAVPTRVKWPNDLHLAGRKVGGILTEARSLKGDPTLALVGIGLNVNQTEGDFPSELATLATSLRAHTRWPLDRALILDNLLDALEEGIDALAKGALGALDEALVERSAVLGKRVRIRGHGGTFTGTVTGQSLTRGLVLQTDEGETRTFRGESIHSLDLLV
jgi:BirA family biotin operon repressor/biotin-[acetyl-CoA-carboxylase] ligase